MAMIRVICFHCAEANEFSERVPNRAECGKCGNDLHVCKCCQFYDPKVYNECREPQAEVVMEKDRANRCEFYQPGAGSGQGSGPTKADLLSAAEALFKKKS